MRKAYAIIICVILISVVFGTTVVSFSNIERAIEEVEASSNTLVSDLASISVFAFIVSDFFEGAETFSLRLAMYQESSGSGVLTGEAKILYVSEKFWSYASDGTPLYKTVRSEEIPLFPKGSGLSRQEMENAFERIKYPVKGFIENERETYTGAFSAVLNAVQFIAYVCMMIYAVLCIIVLILIDTIGIAWALVHAMLKILGLG